MLTPRRRFAPHAARQIILLFALVALCSTLICAAVSSTASAQVAKLERRMSVSGKSKVTVANAPKISISVWDKDEVAIEAECDGASITEGEVRTLTKESGLEISCLPAPKDKPVTLTLRVPKTSVLEWTTFGYKVEIKEPADEMRIIATKEMFHLIVPKTTEIDVRDADDVLRFVRLGNGAGILGRSKKEDFGKGPPYVKASADGAEVLVTNGTIPYDLPFATKTIAAAKGSMGDALRDAYRDLSGATKSKNADSAAGTQPVIQAQEAAVKLETHLVNLNVSVVDKYGKAVADLKQDDFHLFDEDEAQQITFFSPEKAPFNLVLLMDMSGSVRQKIDLIKDAALHFLDTIGPEDRVAVVTFTTDVQIVSHLTNDRERLRERIRNLKPPVGGTSFYDALGYVLTAELAKVRGQRNAVIVITDGEDNSLMPGTGMQGMPKKLADVGFQWPVPRRGSYLTFEQLLEGVLEADAIVYPIHLQNTTALPIIQVNNSKQGTPPSANVRMARAQALMLKETSQKQLEELAEVSGGKLFSAEQIEDLKGVYEQVAAAIATVYSLAYTPKNLTLDGKFRRIRVKLDKEGAALRTRRGYYAR